MTWLKREKSRNSGTRSVMFSGEYEIEKVASKWVVFLNRGDRFPIHKTNTLKGAKGYAERHYFRLV